MPNGVRAYMNWSGGKDSALALQRMSINAAYDVDCLLTSINGVHDRISMHGVRRELLEDQAAAIGLPLYTIELPEQPAMGDYERIMADKLMELRHGGYRASVFGDIFLQDLRTYREERLHEQGIECAFPLWSEDTGVLMEEFFEEGFKAIVVCVNERYLDRSFCGRFLDRDFVKDLPPEVDICGENGEYHSFVFDGPLFRRPVAFEKGNIVRKVYAGPRENGEAVDYGFYFCDLKRIL